MRRSLLLIAALLAAGCAPRAVVPEGERQRASRELEGQLRFTKVALFLGPLFGDAGKLFLSDQPGGELDLLETADGKPIAPPLPDRVLVPGTPLRIETVEFPTGWLIAKRVVMTPRYHPWVYLHLDGEPRPVIVVLPQTVTSAEDVRTEIDRMLGTSDPGPQFHALPDAQRAAIGLKKPIDGMTAQALEMAWGYPERKVIDRPAGTEEWTWPGEKRKASLRDGKLVRWQTPR
jgi:hypothetical protein